MWRDSLGTNTTPAASTASTTRSASGSVMASGFTETMCLPARAAATHSSGLWSTLVKQAIASTSGSSRTKAGSVDVRAQPVSSATCATRAGSRSTRACRETVGSAATLRAKGMPAYQWSKPMMPMRMGVVMLLVPLVR